MIVYYIFVVLKMYNIAIFIISFNSQKYIMN